MYLERWCKKWKIYNMNEVAFIGSRVAACYYIELLILQKLQCIQVFICLTVFVTYTFDVTEFTNCNLCDRDHIILNVMMLTGYLEWYSLSQIRLSNFQIDISRCHYLIDRDTEDWTELEPLYSSSPDWTVIKQAPFLDAGR